MRNFSIMQERSDGSRMPVCSIQACNKLSALRKYRKGRISSGIYDIVFENGQCALVTSFGEKFVAEARITKKEEI